MDAHCNDCTETHYCDAHNRFDVWPLLRICLILGLMAAIAIPAMIGLNGGVDLRQTTTVVAEK